MSENQNPQADELPIPGSRTGKETLSASSASPTVVRGGHGKKDKENLQLEKAQQQQLLQEVVESAQERASRPPPEGLRIVNSGPSTPSTPGGSSGATPTQSPTTAGSATSPEGISYPPGESVAGPCIGPRTMRSVSTPTPKTEPFDGSSRNRLSLPNAEDLPAAALATLPDGKERPSRRRGGTIDTKLGEIVRANLRKRGLIPAEGSQPALASSSSSPSTARTSAVSSPILSHSAVALSDKRNNMPVQGLNTHSTHSRKLSMSDSGYEGDLDPIPEGDSEDEVSGEEAGRPSDSEVDNDDEENGSEGEPDINSMTEEELSALLRSTFVRHVTGPIYSGDEEDSRRESESEDDEVEGEFFDALDQPVGSVPAHPNGVSEAGRVSKTNGVAEVDDSEKKE